MATTTLNSQLSILNGAVKVLPAQQMEFPSLAFAKDRSVLYVFEVAAKLRVTERHVIDLIEEGKIKAINVAGNGNKTERRSFRIPVEAYAEYLRESRI